MLRWVLNMTVGEYVVHDKEIRPEHRKQSENEDRRHMQLGIVDQEAQSLVVESQQSRASVVDDGDRRPAVESQQLQPLDEHDDQTRNSFEPEKHTETVEKHQTTKHQSIGERTETDDQEQRPQSSAYGRPSQQDHRDQPPVDQHHDNGGKSIDDDDAQYPHGLKLFILTTALAMATFLIALDNTIIATAIPQITTAFNSLEDVGWYGSSYLLTTTSLQPSFGKIYAYFDVKWVYLAALLIFEVGSIVCAAATTSTMLIIGRAVAGVGAAALFSGGLTIVAYSVPLRKRPIYIAALSSTFGIAAVVGPILGGVFTDHVSWRWCFWINLPLGAITLVVVAWCFPNPSGRHPDMTTRHKLEQIDFGGAALLVTAVVCLLLALHWGGIVYPWDDARVWGPLVLTAIFLGGFVAEQRSRGDTATIPPRIVRQRTVAFCALFSCFLAMALYTHVYYLPFYFQAVKGTSAEGSGLRCIPYLVSLTLSSLITGALITYVGHYVPILWVGSAIFVVGSALLHTLDVDTPTAYWVGAELLAGVGVGACVQTPFVAVQVVLDEKDMPIGNALIIFSNTLGGAVAVSLAHNIFSNALRAQLPGLAPGISPLLVLHAGATHLRSAVSPAALAGVLRAFAAALATAFVLPVVAAGLALGASAGVEWRTVRGRGLHVGGVA